MRGNLFWQDRALRAARTAYTQPFNQIIDEIPEAPIIPRSYNIPVSKYQPAPMVYQINTKPIIQDEVYGITIRSATIPLRRNIGAANTVGRNNSLFDRTLLEVPTTVSSINQPLSARRKLVSPSAFVISKAGIIQDAVPLSIRRYEGIRLYRRGYINPSSVRAPKVEEIEVPAVGQVMESYRLPRRRTPPTSYIILVSPKIPIDIVTYPLIFQPLNTDTYITSPYVNQVFEIIWPVVWSDNEYYFTSEEEEYSFEDNPT
jgi:hypothetical protein